MSIVPIGIDLGTNNSCISFVDGNAIKCVPNPISKTNTHASVVYIPLSASINPTTSTITVGQEALNSGQTEPKQLIYCVKRLIGHTTVPTVNNFAYTVESDDGNIIIKIPQTPDPSNPSNNELIYSPVDISAFILSYLRRCAEIFFNPPDLDTPMRIYKTAEKAVITVPAAFSSEQRRLTRSAARHAGIDCLRILSEPTAAAMAYIYAHFHDPTFQDQQKLDPDKPINLLMFDLGGGTFDVSIVSVAKEGFQVRSTAGNNAFGGEDIDAKIAEDIKRQYAKEAVSKGLGNNITFPTHSERSLRKLRKEAQKLKEKLSDQISYVIDIEKEDWGLLFDFKWEYKRSRLELLLAREFERGCAPVVLDALNKANLTPNDIFQCVLVGGSTRIPFFRSSLEKLLNLPISRAINPDEAVSKGAAYLASYLVNRQLRQHQKFVPNQQNNNNNNNNTVTNSTSLLDFTEVSLARGELSAFTYSIACGDDSPAVLITSGSELPTNGEHFFFLRHENPDDPLFDNSPVVFYIYEGQDKSEEFFNSSNGQNNAQNSPNGQNNGQNNQNTPPRTYKIEPPRRLFEIYVARQRVETQTISFYTKLDADGVLDVFIVDEDEHFQIPNIDLPEIQALLQLQDSLSFSPSSVPSSPSHSQHSQSQFSLPRTPNGSISSNNNNNSHISSGIRTISDTPFATTPSTLQPRRQSLAFNTSKRLPIKIPANVKNQAGTTFCPTLQPPPPPRAPRFERLPDPPELLGLTSIPHPPSTQPVVPRGLIDKFYSGYTNPEFVFMRQYRTDGGSVFSRGSSVDNSPMNQNGPVNPAGFNPNLNQNNQNNANFNQNNRTDGINNTITPNEVPITLTLPDLGPNLQGERRPSNPFNTNNSPPSHLPSIPSPPIRPEQPQQQFNQQFGTGGGNIRRPSTPSITTTLPTIPTKPTAPAPVAPVVAVTKPSVGGTTPPFGTTGRPPVPAVIAPVAPLGNNINNNNNNNNNVSTNLPPRRPSNTLPVLPAGPPVITTTAQPRRDSGAFLPPRPPEINTNNNNFPNNNNNNNVNNAAIRRDSNPFAPRTLPPTPRMALPTPPVSPIPTNGDTITNNNNNNNNITNNAPSTLPPSMKPPSTLPPTMRPPQPR